jgi:hypothetical protein
MTSIINGASTTLISVKLYDAGFYVDHTIANFLAPDEWITPDNMRISGILLKRVTGKRYDITRNLSGIIHYENIPYNVNGTLTRMNTPIFHLHPQKALNAFV